MNVLTKFFTSTPNDKTVRFAVVGMGNFAQAAILPAFANATDKAKLAAIVTGDPEKARKLGRKYAVTTYDYEQYEELLGSGEIDAVYIVVPNSEHRRFTVAAARARVHVLCEKPLAYSVKDAQVMVDACRAAKVHLSGRARLRIDQGLYRAVPKLVSCETRRETTAWSDCEAKIYPGSKPSAEGEGRSDAIMHRPL